MPAAARRGFVAVRDTLPRRAGSGVEVTDVKPDGRFNPSPRHYALICGSDCFGPSAGPEIALDGFGDRSQRLREVVWRPYELVVSRVLERIERPVACGPSPRLRQGSGAAAERTSTPQGAAAGTREDTRHGLRKGCESVWPVFRDQRPLRAETQIYYRYYSCTSADRIPRPRGPRRYSRAGPVARWR